jgi:outer membrane protein assembly factor BamB
MYNKKIKHLISQFVLLFLSIIFLSGCNGFFDKDNTPPPRPLTHYPFEINPRFLWSVNTGSGSGGEYLKTSPAIGATDIVTASMNGVITSVNKFNGRINWRTDTRMLISAGPGIGDQLVVAASHRGDIVALSERNGRILWRTVIPGEILANPAIDRGIIIIKAIDGNLRALSTADGHEVWSFRQVEPNLILRGSSRPLIRDNNVIAGFANGNLSKLNLHDGQLLWQQAVAIPEGAFAIQRMIDIDADPTLFDHHLYAATYQGKIASLDWISGKILWNYDISSYTGMIADENTVYISDAKSFIWAFGADNGLVNWRQTALEARIVSGPASMGNYIVVGDAQGYLHWLSKQDGHLAGRIKLNSAIYASPVAENNVLYALTNKGYLVAYTYSR